MKTSTTSIALASSKPSPFQLLAAQWQKVFLALATLYSDLLEAPISASQAKHFVHAQVAVFFLLLSASSTMPLILASLLWAAWAVKGCVKSFLDVRD